MAEDSHKQSPGLLLRLVTPIDSVQEPNRRRLSALLVSIMIFMILLEVLLYVVRMAAGVETWSATVTRIIVGVALLISYLLSRQGYYQIASILVSVTGTLMLYVLAFSVGSETGLQILNYLAVMVVFSALFLSLKLIVGVFVLQVAGLIIFALIVPGFTLPEVIDGPVSFNVTMAVILFAITYHRDWLEKTWRRSEILYSSLVTALAEGVMVHDDRGVIIAANPTAERILGEDLIGKSLADLDLSTIHEDGSPFPSSEHPVTLTLQSGTTQTDVPMGIYKPDGTLAWASISSAPLYEEHETKPHAVVVSFVDITERKRIEIEHNANRDLLQATIDGINDPIMLIGADYGIRLMNKAAREQYAGNQLGQLYCYQVSHHRDTPCDGCEHPCPLEDVRKSLKPVTVTHEHVRQDGETRFVEIIASPLYDRQGAFTGIVESARDITERLLIEQELRQLSRAVQQSANTIVITDLDGNIEFANPMFTKTTGYTIEEALGQNPRILKSGESPPEVYEELWATIAAGKEWRGEFHNKRKDGSLYWESASISPIRDAAGEITHYLAAKEDITLRKEAEEALQRHTVELEARNEELDAFAHTVAHDLKNPIHVILLHADLLESYYSTDLNDKVSGYLRVIAKNATVMTSIIDELLLLASVRDAEVKIEAVDMGRVVNKAVYRLEHMSAEYKAEIISPDSWPTVLGYSPWLIEVWVNYLSNAMKYGGQPPRIELGADRDGKFVSFWVRDNGPGLTTEEQDRLFTPFTRLDQVKATGYGLGLSIVLRIIKKLGGEVGITSEVGKGSVFCFTLPVVPD